jgi:TolA-binding protein
MDADQGERASSDGKSESLVATHPPKTANGTPMSGVPVHDIAAPSSGAPRDARSASAVTAPADEGVDPEGSGAARRTAAAEVFERAMGGFTAGNYLEADEQFAAFAARFPADARREDAAFLRAVIATRRGDAAAAVARARDYLARFPRGLRRSEMERLVNAPW